jgi:N-methylhydantoinase A
VRIERWLDLRYVGQAYELTVPATGEFVSAFHRAHLRQYGYQDSSRPVEVVNIRCRFVAATPKPGWARAKRGPLRKPKMEMMNHCIFRGKSLETPVYVRENLRAGHHFRGPAIVTEYSATTAVPPGWQVRVDAFENLLLTRLQETMATTGARGLHEPRR